MKSTAATKDVPRTKGHASPRALDDDGPKKSSVSLSSMRHAFSTIIWPRRKLIFWGLVLIFANRLSGLVLPG